MEPRRSKFPKGAARGAMPALIAIGIVFLPACGSGPGNGGGGSDPADPPPAAAPEFTSGLLLLDEDGTPVAGATVTRHDDQAARQGGGPSAARTTVVSGADGRAPLERLTGPIVLLVEADGFLPEPVVVGRDEAGKEVAVRLLARRGPSGRTRLVLHLAGDVMLGRRYLTPVLDYTAVVTPGDGGASARAVVSSAAPLVAAADITSLNLETVVGTLPEEAAYPRKRFLLESPPEVVHALDALGADIVTLGNNHARDWLEDGVRSTIEHLDAAGVPHVGAALTAAAASAPRVLAAAGHGVAFLSYTTVNGNFVNDSLPGELDPIPPDLDLDELWQYEERVFGFAGSTIVVAPAARRIGTVWRLFHEAEAGGLAAPEAEEFWREATTVFPELQDWVARRGHGGANPYSPAAMRDEIAALRAAGHDLVVVQFHSGFQFFEFKSGGTELAAHAAIEAGADLVVCHHPHVLQGCEWYAGKLIAYSLGNAVFDQDFLSTFRSALLRVVFERNELVEARLLPLALINYRPVPLAGASAARVLQAMAEASTLEARCERVDGGVRRLLAPLAPGAEVPVFLHERNSARLLRGEAIHVQRTVTASFDAPAFLAPGALTRSRGPEGAELHDVFLGRDLLGWGDFEDDGTDSATSGGTHWEANESYKRVEVVDGAPSGIRCLRLRRSAANETRVLARPRARVSFTRNRLFRLEPDGTARPADGDAFFSVRFMARLEGGGSPLLRLDVYHFDDSNPTEDPESIRIRSRFFPVPVAADGAWHEVLFDVPPDVFASPAGSGLEPNAVLLYVGLEPPPGGVSVLLADDVAFLEWRRVADLPDGFHAAAAVRAAAGAGAVDVTLEEIPGSASP